jgi:hypothetical protein
MLGNFVLAKVSRIGFLVEVRCELVPAGWVGFTQVEIWEFGLQAAGYRVPYKACGTGRVRPEGLVLQLILLLGQLWALIPY